MLDPFRQDLQLPVQQVWLRDCDGRVFHFSFTGATWPAVNTPANPYDLSRAVEKMSPDGKTFKLFLPKGIITLDLVKVNASDGFSLTGGCSNCGECCAGCEHLVLRKSGKSSCAIYGRRLYRGFKPCVLFPSQPVALNKYPRCTYEFDQMEPNGRGSR